MLDGRNWGMHRLGGARGGGRLLRRAVAQGAVEALPVVEDLDVFQEGRPRLRLGAEVAQIHLTVSMSRKGNCWDNACIESWHSLLKKELHRVDCHHHSNAKARPRETGWPSRAKGLIPCGDSLLRVFPRVIRG